MTEQKGSFHRYLMKLYRLAIRPIHSSQLEFGEHDDPWILCKKNGITRYKSGWKFRECGLCPNCGYELIKPEENQSESEQIEEVADQDSISTIASNNASRKVGVWSFKRCLKWMINPFAKPKKEDSGRNA